MQRWLFILLAVGFGWFLPANAQAHTRAGGNGYDAGQPLAKVVWVAGITGDTFQSAPSDPLSLHKYLYCQANPVNLTDPSGFASLQQNLGYDAEEAIENEYGATHNGKLPIFYGQEVSYNIGGVTGVLKPDIFNPNDKKFLEIKPISTGGVVTGPLKILIDYGAFPKYSADTKWQPRRSLLITPSSGTTIFVVNIGGVVFYQNIDLLQKQLILAAVLTTPKQLLQFLRFPQLGQFAPTFARVMGFATGGVETSAGTQLVDDLGIGTLNALGGAE